MHFLGEFLVSLTPSQEEKITKIVFAYTRKRYAQSETKC